MSVEEHFDGDLVPDVEASSPIDRASSAFTQQ
jgi:hypothetical protein